MNTVCAPPEHGLAENLCGNCGSPLHLHVCALCQTVTSCRLCSEPFHVAQRPANYALPAIRPTRVAFRIERHSNRFRSRVRTTHAAARRSDAARESESAPPPPNLTEIPRSGPPSIQHSEMAAQSPAAAVNDLLPVSDVTASGNSEAAVPASGAVKAGPSGVRSAATASWRSPLLLMVATGLAVAGYYAITPTDQTPPISATANVGTVSGTGAGAPDAARERYGEITQQPRLEDGGARSQASFAQEPVSGNAISVAGSHSALPEQGNKNQHATAAATDDVPVAAAAPMPHPVSPERLPPKAEAAHTVIVRQAPASSSSTDVVNSQAGGDAGVPDRTRKSSSIANQAGDGPSCSTASAALGLCNARTR
jgi:hypothetical protein